MQELNLNYNTNLYSISEQIEPVLNASTNEDLIINYSFDFNVYCYNTHNTYKFNVYCNEWDINIYCDDNTEDVTLHYIFYTVETQQFKVVVGNE